VEVLIASVVGLAELGLALMVFLSVLAPDRAPRGLAQIPLYWRLSFLLFSSVIAGAVIQLAGASHRIH
jgi:hypothetical protein